MAFLASCGAENNTGNYESNANEDYNARRNTAESGAEHYGDASNDTATVAAMQDTLNPRAANEQSENPINEDLKTDKLHAPKQSVDMRDPK